MGRALLSPICLCGLSEGKELSFEPQGYCVEFYGVRSMARVCLAKQYYTLSDTFCIRIGNVHYDSVGVWSP